MPAPLRQCIPCGCTFLALCAGVGSLLAAGMQNFLLSAQLILVSLILDGLDGTLARLLRGQSSFGAELDTFVDITSFGIAPAVLLYLHPDGLQAVPFWGLVLAFLYAASGAARLSRFRVVDPYRGQRGFLGLPITTAAGFVAAYLIALESPAVAEIPWMCLRSGVLAAGFWLAVLAMLVLQVSHVRYSKPTKNPKVLVPFMACVVMLFIPSVAIYSALAMFAYGVWFAFISPFFFHRFLAHLPPAEELKSVAGADGAEDDEP
jgi:CDP-diacylglycerol---serine O-phosphatidyltransferase